jgi:hypothetical protein
MDRIIHIQKILFEKCDVPMFLPKITGMHFDYNATLPIMLPLPSTGEGYSL